MRFISNETDSQLLLWVLPVTYALCWDEGRLRQQHTLGIQSLPILCSSWPRGQLHWVNVQRKQQFSNLPETGDRQP